MRRGELHPPGGIKRRPKKAYGEIQHEEQSVQCKHRVEQPNAERPLYGEGHEVDEQDASEQRSLQARDRAYQHDRLTADSTDTC